MKNWNDYSDSYESDQQEQLQRISPTINQVQQKNQSNTKIQQPLNNQQQNKTQTNFLTDEEILKQFQQGKVQEDHALRIVNCRNQDLKKIISEHKLIKKLTQFKEHCYFSVFQTKQNLMEFIKQKIQKKYRFFIQICLKKPKPQHKNYQNRDKNKLKYVPKDQHETKKNHKDSYEGFHWKESYLHLTASSLQISTVVKSLQAENIKKHFSTIRVIIPLKMLETGQKVIQAIIQQTKWFESQKNEIIENGEKFIEIKIVQKKQEAPKDNKNIKYDEKRKEEKYKNEKKQQKSTKYIEKKSQSNIKEKTRHLTKNEEKHFFEIKVTNMNQIMEDFDEKIYCDLLKKNLKQIFCQWNNWVVIAHDKLIEKLLDVSWRIKKEGELNVKYSASTKDKEVELRIELTPNNQGPKQKKEERPKKVDPSFINSYLTNC